MKSAISLLPLFTVLVAVAGQGLGGQEVGGDLGPGVARRAPGGVVADAGSGDPHPDPLRRYLEVAVERNLDLARAGLSSERAEAEYRELRSDLRPELSVRARYSVAEGGRVIDVPVGDLVNPAYRALEALSGGARTFPVIEDQEIPFLRDREQETRLHLRMPVFRPELRAAVRASRARASAADAEVAATRDVLRRDVVSAWYRLLSAEASVAILTSATEVVEEAVRVTERMRAAERVTPDEVLRVRAEALEVEQRLTEARSGVRLARSAFNRLLDRPLDEAVPTVPVRQGELEAALGRVGLEEGLARPGSPAPGPVPFPGPDTDPKGDPTEPDTMAPDHLARLRSEAVRNRAELRMLRRSLEGARAGVDARRSRRLPTLSLAVDGGIQGRDYALDDDGPFVMASAVVEWTLFGGGGRNAAIEGARLRAREVELQERDMRRAVDLQVQDAFEGVRSGLRSLDAARERRRAAREAFRLVDRRRREGLVNQLTFMDARDAMTRAELNLSRVRHTLLDRLSILAWAVGSGR